MARLLQRTGGREDSAVKSDEKPIANPYVMLREEFDDWAVLFDPDRGRGFGLNPTGVYVWKVLDGEHTLDDLLEELRAHAGNMPADARDHIEAFVDALTAEGLTAFDSSASGRGKCSHASLAGTGEVTSFTYEAPRLISLNSPQAATGKTCTPHGSQAAYCCSGASAATSCSSTGTCPGYSSSCITGDGDTSCCSSGICTSGYVSCCTTGNCKSGTCYCIDGCNADAIVGRCWCGSCPNNSGLSPCSAGGLGAC